ncbi:hypothetical protein Avbf_08400 [Armadillidium vulgare]|nr:hypothetical protein Avbf_08400 [Armadillidium vulgare]
MEDSPPLKIRSDLYPHARAPQNMTSTSDSAPTVPHKMTPSATLSQQCKPSDNEKEQKKEEDFSDKTLSPQQYSSPPRNVNWGPTTGVSGDDCEKRKSSLSPSSNACRRTPTESVIESSLVEPNEENENWEDVPQRADSPLEHSPSAYSQGTAYRLPHGIQETNENIMVNREYASPLAASVDKTAIPPLSFHPFIHTRTESETCYNERSPQSSDHEEPIEVGEEETLDLSLSTRSKESKMSRLPTSPTPPPAPFNPFVAFPGLAARFHEMNPMFHDGYEQGVPKSPFASSLYGSNLPPHLIPWIISSQIQNLVQQQQAARAEGNRANILESCNGAISLEDRDQQPLDLSAKKQDEPKILAPEDDLVARVLEMKPSTRGRRRADNSKRSYTDFELHAALREIQSGKLGTRKAAVYKLQLVRDSAKNATDQKNNLASTLPDSTATCRAPLFPSKPPECDANEDNQSEALKSIIRKKMTEKLDELSRSSQTYLSGGDQQRLVESALMYLFENIPKLALNSDNKDVPSDVLINQICYHLRN